MTSILQVNTHYIAKYIDSKMPSDSISEHLVSLSISMLCMLIVLCTTNA